MHTSINQKGLYHPLYSTGRWLSGCHPTGLSWQRLGSLWMLRGLFNSPSYIEISLLMGIVRASVMHMKKVCFYLICDGLQVTITCRWYVLLWCFVSLIHGLVMNYFQLLLSLSSGVCVCVCVSACVCMFRLGFGHWFLCGLYVDMKNLSIKIIF